MSSLSEQIQELPRPLLFALLGVLAAGALLFAMRRGGEETASAPPAQTSTPAPSATGTQSGTQSQAGSETKSGQQGSGAAAEPKAKPRGLPSDVANALDAHKVVTVLFYNPKSPDDLNVKRSVEGISSHGGKVASFTDTLTNVARYTRVTGSQGVEQTPTIVVIDEHGNGRIATGFQDDVTVDQLVVDALR